MLSTTRLIASATLFACLIVGRVCLAQYAPATTEVLVQTGDATPSGVGQFSGFGNLTVSSQGSVAFTARSAGVGVSDSNNTGIYRADSQSTVVIAREGQTLPGSSDQFGDFESGFFRPISINDSGSVAFDGRVLESGSIGSPLRAVFAGNEIQLAERIRQGDSITGLTPNVQFISQFGIDQSGSVTVETFDAYLAVDEAGVQILTEIGDTAPNGQGQLSAFNSAFANTTGQTAIYAEIDRSFQSPDSAILRADKNGVVTLVRNGQFAPNSSARFAGVTSPRLNNLGQAAFTAFLEGPRVTFENESGIYLADDLSVTEIVRSGDIIPDGSAAFSSLDGIGTFENPVIGDGGDVAFLAFLSGDQVDFTNESGLYRGNGDTLIEVARAGQPVPDGPGEFFDFAFERKAVNQQGQVLFSNLLSGDGVDFTNNTGLYLYDDTLGLMTVARTGAELFGSTITSLSLGGGEDSLTTSLSDQGQVAYRFTLANGTSGIALFTPPRLIPEPTTVSIALLSCAGFIMSTRRARRGR